MITKTKILVLYSSVPDYIIAGLEYLHKMNIDVILFYNNVDLNAPYEHHTINYFTSINIKTIEPAEFKQIINSFNPSLVYVCGWSDSKYLKTARLLYKNKIPIILALDNPWFSTTRQWIGILIFKFIWSKRFTHAFVAGSSQFEFARRLGFSKNNIIRGVYSARTDLFSKSFNNRNFYKSNPKILLFVGRLVEYKGLKLLYDSFNYICKTYSITDWQLHIYGEGPLRSDLSESDIVKKFDFVQPIDLIDIFKNSHAFCLLSENENWGVSVHEAACAGLPLILSKGVSSKEEYLINGYNGILVKNNSIQEVNIALLNFFNLSDSTLYSMSLNSVKLSKRNTTEFWAYNLLSIAK